MEGATGIAMKDQCRKGSPYYQEGRRLLTHDVNAVIAGAFDGGAEEVIVADMHNGSFNLIHEELDRRAEVLYGVPHRGPRFPALTDDVDAMMLVAYHARAGTKAAVLDHTMSSRTIQRITVNGIEIGETGIEAGLAGAVGVPVVFVSGDDKVCGELSELLGPIAAISVKKGLARERALCLSQEKTEKLLREGASRALSLCGRIKPLIFDQPVEVVVEYKSTAAADGVDLDNPAIRRLDGYRVQYTYDSFADWYGGAADKME